MNRRILCIAVSIFFVGGTLWAQAGSTVTIRELLNDAEFWMNKQVTVEAFVRDIQVLEANFVHYKLEDFAGEEIWVKKETRSNADHPVLHQKLVVTGVVHRNSDFPVARSEILLFEELPPVVEAQEVEPPPPAPWWKENLLLVLLLVVFFLLFVALVLVLLWPTISRKPVVATPPAAGAHQPLPPSPIGGIGPETMAAAGAPTVLGEQPTPVFRGPAVGQAAGVGEMKTPFYYGHLVVEESSEADLMGKTFDLAFPGGKSEALLGRSNQADIRVPHKYLSRRHLRIQHKDGKLIAIKVPGAQETQVDGNALDEQYGATLETGSVITMPGLVLKVELG